MTKRRTLSQFGSTDTIDDLALDVRPADAKLLLAAAGAAFVVFGRYEDVLGVWWSPFVVAPVALSIPAAAAVVVYLAPEHETSPAAWLKSILSFRRDDKERSALDDDAENRTETLTQVAQFHPDEGSVERVDGDLVGGVRVDPANLSLASRERWDAATDDLGAAINSLGFDVLFHSTARRVDAERLTGDYAGRMDDPDVRANDTLREIVRVYDEQWASEFAARGTALREYYVLVPAGVRDAQLADHGVAGRLRALPLVGGVIETVAGEATDMTDAELRAEQLDTLGQRLDDVEAALGGVDGVGTERLTSDDLARVIEEYWTGRRTEYDDEGDRLRSFPVVTRGTNGES